MPTPSRSLKGNAKRFLQMDGRRSVGDAFRLLTTPQVSGQSWWHLVVLKADGSWAAVRFSDLYEAVSQDHSLLDTPLEWVEALHPLQTAERNALDSGQALRLARRSPGRLLGLIEGNVLTGIIFEGAMRGGSHPSLQELRQLAGASQEALREHRYTDISCPRRVSRRTERFSLVVRLLLQPSRLSVAQLEMEPEAGRTVQVRLQAPGFEVLGKTFEQIRLEPLKDSPPAVFDLRPLEIGAGRLSLEFYQDGNWLGTVGVPIQVVGEPVAEAAAVLPSQELPAAPGANAPDMVLRIIWDKERASLHFSLMRDGGTFWQEFPAIPLEQSPSDYAQSLFGDLTQWSEASLQESSGIANGEGLSIEQLERRLKAVGRNLWRDVLPEKLKRLYSEERHAWKDRSMVILSDEPYLPWEVVWPYGDDWEDEEPWCLRLRLCRWLCRDDRGNGNPSPPGRLRFSSLLLLAAADPSLPLVSKERELLLRLLQGRAIRTLIPQPVTWEKTMQMLDSADYDWLHLASHGDFSNQSPDRHSPLFLNGHERLTPLEFVGPCVEGHLRRKRPAFVLNACHAGRQEFGLTRLDGWAARLIGMGAGMFLGPLWAVNEASALKLMHSWYQGLLKGLTVAEALTEARRAARQKGNLSWLAYCLYGHPNASLEWGPAAQPLND